ncbi:hypothetical protein D3C72_1635930 [compost metagenome]
MVTGGDDRKYRAEDLLSGDGHVVADVVENGRRDVEALGAQALLDPFTTEDQLCALLHAFVDIAQYPLQLAGIDDGAKLGGWVQWISDGDGACHLEHLGNELGADASFDNQPRGRHADFALVEEHRAGRSGRGLLQVTAVIENDVRGLPAALQPHPLHVRLPRVLQEQLADLAGAGEHQGINVHVQAQRLARGGAKARQHVEHTGRDTGFGGQLGNTQGSQR